MVNFLTYDEYLNERIFQGKAFNYDDNKKEAYKERLNYFNEFFDVSRLKGEEVYDFIFSVEEEHRRFKSVLLDYCPFDSYDKTNIFEQYDSVDGKINFLKNFKNKEIAKFYKSIVKAILWLSFLNPYSNNQTTNENFKDDIEIIEYYKDKKINGFFRGQSDFSWQLKPSLLRGFDYDKKDGCTIDNNMLYDIYNRVGLINKYNSTISKKEIKSGRDIDYDFLSFMQHAISYSPLIDFTGKIDVAYKFALQKNSPNTYLKKDSAVFILSFERSRESFDISKFNLIYLTKKIRPGSIMTIVDSKGKTVTLDFTTITKIKNQLRPKFSYFEIESNDRMKYQSGKFILFYDYVSVKGNVYYMLNKQMHIIKRKIEPSKKDSILASIDDNLNNSYLMNPYQVFND